jgi:hypothetical protein
MHAAYYLLFNKDNVNVDDLDVLSCRKFQFHCSKDNCPNLTFPIRINGRCQPSHGGSCAKCKNKSICFEKPNNQLPADIHVILRRNRAVGVKMVKNIESTENVIPSDLVDVKKVKTKEAIRFWAKLYHAAPPDAEETTDAIVDPVVNDTEMAGVNDDAAVGEILEATDMDLSGATSSDSDSDSATHRSTSPTVITVNTDDSHRATLQSPSGESSPIIGADPLTPLSPTIDPHPEPVAEPVFPSRSTSPPRETVVTTDTDDYHLTALRLAQSFADGSSSGVDAAHRLEALRICADLIRLKKEETSNRIKEAEVKQRTVVSKRGSSRSPHPPVGNTEASTSLPKRPRMGL